MIQAEDITAKLLPAEVEFLQCLLDRYSEGGGTIDLLNDHEGFMAIVRKYVAKTQAQEIEAIKKDLPMGQPEMTEASHALLRERKRQIEKEGWLPNHDDEHDRNELGYAASCYADPSFINDGDLNYAPPKDWPWEDGSWKPKTYKENLIRAGALILAELDRLNRLEESERYNATERVKNG